MRLTPLRITITSLAVATLLWLAFGYFGVQALFTNTTVEDPLPRDPQASGPDHTSLPTPNALQTASSSAQAVFAGDFTQGDSTYRIRGEARIVTENGERLLLLRDFDVTNGPDLFVYFVAASSTENADVKQQASEGRFVQLAPLKGNRGNQTYVLPADLDASAYPVVSIWCRRFSRNFGSALLKMEEPHP